MIFFLNINKNDKSTKTKIKNNLTKIKMNTENIK